MVVVAAGGSLIYGDTLARAPSGVPELARELVLALEAAALKAGALPARLQVGGGQLARALAVELAPRGVVVETGPLEHLRTALRTTLEQLSETMEAWMVSPQSWRDTGASPEELQAFHTAAAEYFTGAPWTRYDSGDALLLEFPDGSAWAASVLGSGGMEFGLALYSDPADLVSQLEGELEEAEAIMDMEGTALTNLFERRAELPRAIRNEVTRGRWPVAGPAAYPLLIGLHLAERRVTAEHVRRATHALRAVTLAAAGGDPQASSGVRVSPLHHETRVLPWPVPDQATPIGPEGRGADPEAALRGWEAPEEVRRVEGERTKRMRAWLEANGGSGVKADLRNARAWTEFLEFHGLPAGAVTEHDLRLFIYDFYPRDADATKAAARALPRSLARICRFLEEREEIRYPFAAAVLEELEALKEHVSGEGFPFEDVLDEVSEDLYPYLDLCEMLHDRDLPGVPGGWPGFMDMRVAELEHELQRRWLLWYDEEVRGGVSHFPELREALVARQRVWEITPHPAHGGRTPAGVVRAMPRRSRRPAVCISRRRRVSRNGLGNGGRGNKWLDAEGALPYRSGFRPGRGTPGGSATPQEYAPR